MSSFRLFIIFLIALSLAALPGPLAHLPTAHANLAPVEPWYPAGPAHDKLAYLIFTDENTEFTTGLQAGTIDLTDWPLTPPLIASFVPSTAFYVTSPISAKEYFELEFHLDTNFWGCQMNFGNSACGKDIRQGIAHLVDKTIFTATQADLAGLAVPVDNPVPPSTGLPAPNPCQWDSAFSQTGSGCQVGAPGGTAYHRAPATGVVYPWQPALGSPDFCAAARHFILAGIATGNTTLCVLTGISAAASSNTVNLFARSDSPPRLELGNGITQELCALFTGTFSTGCSPYVSETPGPITAFPGFTTSTTLVAQSWNIYTAGINGVLTFDSTLFFEYNSQFVSGIPSIRAPNGPCSAQSVPTFAAPNYMYLCDANFDNISSQMEFAPCLSAPGDPTVGQLSPTFANCFGSSQLTSTSAGYQTADVYGRNAYTIPIWSGNNRYAYNSNWQRVVNNAGVGLLNYFAQLNAYNPTPTQAGTIRQGYKQPVGSLNPYIGNTVWDFGVMGNIWDSLNIVNPEANSQLMEWMTYDTRLILNTQGLGYTPPTGTVATYRFTLRNDIFWQDTKKMTAWDVAFSFLTLKATGAFQASGLAPMIGVRVLSSNQIDVNLNAIGPFTRLSLTGPTIIPGRYWSQQCPGGIWDGNLAIGKIPDRCMTVDPAKMSPNFDPLAAGILVGSGPWQCKSSTGTLGAGCSSTGTQTQPAGGSITLQRYGIGTVPGTSLNTFFRSSGNLALYLWSGNNGRANSDDFINFSIASGPHCYGAPLGTVGCTHWQQGIGAPTGSAIIGIIQIGIIQRFYQLNWVAPYDWQLSPPVSIGTFPPVLYEGAATLNPARIAGCTGTYPNAGYDC